MMIYSEAEKKYYITVVIYEILLNRLNRSKRYLRQSTPRTALCTASVSLLPAFCNGPSLSEGAAASGLRFHPCALSWANDSARRSTASPERTSDNRSWSHRCNRNSGMVRQTSCLKHTNSSFPLDNQHTQNNLRGWFLRFTIKFHFLPRDEDWGRRSHLAQLSLHKTED